MSYYLFICLFFTFSFLSFLCTSSTLNVMAVRRENLSSLLKLESVFKQDFLKNLLFAWATKVRWGDSFLNWPGISIWLSIQQLVSTTEVTDAADVCMFNMCWGWLLSAPCPLQDVAVDYIYRQFNILAPHMCTHTQVCTIINYII